MRRPSVIFLLGLMLGIYWSWTNLWSSLFFVLLLGFGLGWHRNRQKAVTALVGVLIGLLLTSVRLTAYQDHGLVLAAQLEDQGYIQGIAYQRDFLDSKSWWLKVDGNQFVKLKLPRSMNTDQLTSGKGYSVKGKWLMASPARNPKGFDEKKWLYSKKAVGSLQVTSLETWKNHRDVLENTRRQISLPLLNALLQYTAFKQGPLAAGMLLGEDSWIDADTQQAFKLSGTNHILSVSGAHFGVLLFWVYLLANRKEGGYWPKKILVWTLLGAFIWLIGSDSAALRAYVMFLVYELTRISYKQTDSLNALGLTASLMLLVNPFMLWDLGLQLALSAMYGLCILSPFMMQILLGNYAKPDRNAKKLEKDLPFDFWQWQFNQFLKLARVLITSFAVCLCLYPFLRNQFNTFTWLSLIYNIPVSVFSALTLPLSAATGILTPVPFLAKGIGIVNGAVLALMTKTVSTCLLFAKNTYLPSLSSLQTELLVIILLVPLYFKQIPEAVKNLQNASFIKRDLKALGLFLVLLWYFAVCQLPSSGLRQELVVYYFDVGQGDGTLILTPDNKAILVDAGLAAGNRQVFDSLLKLGVDHLDVLMISHPHADHIGGALKIAENMTVENLVYFEGLYNPTETAALGALKAEVEAQEGRLIPVTAGDQVPVGSQVVVMIRYPQARQNTDSANDESLVASVNYKNVSFLFTGDISEKWEYDIMEQSKTKLTVLKVPHHGSKTSSGERLLSDPSLALAIIQVGEQNRYGHPTSEALARLEAHRMPIYRTDQNGCVIVSTDGETVNSRGLID